MGRWRSGQPTIAEVADNYAVGPAPLGAWIRTEPQAGLPLAQVSKARSVVWPVLSGGPVFDEIERALLPASALLLLDFLDA